MKSFCSMFVVVIELSMCQISTGKKKNIKNRRQQQTHTKLTQSTNGTIGCRKYKQGKRFDEITRGKSQYDMRIECWFSTATDTDCNGVRRASNAPCTL